MMMMMIVKSFYFSINELKWCMREINIQDVQVR